MTPDTQCTLGFSVFFGMFLGFGAGVGVMFLLILFLGNFPYKSK